tara:strand:+ start:2745 stop:3740 length:996 start_codon:yes stop_codon:yes gene_type:complete
MQKYIIKTIVIVLNFCLFPLYAAQNPADERDARILMHSAQKFINDEVIPSIANVHGEKVRRIISKTDVIVTPGAFNAEVTRTRNGRYKVEIGGLVVLLADIFANAVLIQQLYPEKNAQIGDYYSDFIDWALTFDQSKVKDGVFPGMYQVLGISQDDITERLIPLGGQEYANLLIGITTHQILSFILSHEYAHIYLEHLNGERISNYKSRKQEWHSDIEALTVLARQGHNAVTYIPPLGVIPLMNVFAHIENPNNTGTHPSAECRVLYGMDGYLFFGYNMLDSEKNNKTITEEHYFQKKAAYDFMNSIYENRKKSFKLSEICDGFVNLNTYN